MQTLFVHESRRYPSDAWAREVWLRLAAAQARAICCEAFSPTRFEPVLPRLRGLSRRTPEEFFPQLVRCCAAAGVAVVVVPGVEKCRVSSAAAMLSPRRAMIALSIRYKRDDHFWFSFFAAAGSLVHECTRASTNEEPIRGDSCRFVDHKACGRAAELLIPPDAAAELPQLSTEEQVQAFAERLGTAPGIVVGRLQHDGLLPWDKMNHLKRRVDLSWALVGQEAVCSTWQSVSEAAELLQNDVSDPDARDGQLSLARARARVSVASRRGWFTSNGRAKYEHRIEPVSFAAWRLQQRERDLGRWEEEDAA